MPPISAMKSDFVVESLGTCRHPSPLPFTARASNVHFVREDARVALDVDCYADKPSPSLFVETAGPRERLFFEPSRVRAAIATCGGLCPGINNVVRAIVLELHHHYRVPSVLGFPFGYEGLDPASHLDPIPLGPDQVRTIHKSGGSVLGTS